MLTSVRIRNFKQFEDIEIELGQTVVLIGPNNSGKTSVLQALALWYAGLEKCQQLLAPGMDDVTNASINRYDLAAIPVPNANLLWRNLHTSNSEPLMISIEMQGQNQLGKLWFNHLDFGYVNEESLICFPKRSYPKLPAFETFHLAYLPSMSGLIATEPRLERGRINVLIGEGRTAEVLRNLCYLVYEEGTHWQALQQHMRAMFAVDMLPPEYLIGRGEIRMSFREAGGITLDLSAAGRGMLQMLLLLAYLYANPGTVLLLDEPDAHLEILRQRQVYQLLTEIARVQNSQVIIATHSEVILNEAGDRDLVLAFIGKPHRIDDRSQRGQVAKALKEIGFEHYYQAEQTGWVLYLEGATDLAILRALAATLNHPAQGVLASPYVHYVANVVNSVRQHYPALREAKPDLQGVALFDRLERGLPDDLKGLLTCLEWTRREIENYLCQPETLAAYAREQFGEQGQTLIATLIREYVAPVDLRERDSKWWRDVKASDDFLDRLFEAFFKQMQLPHLMRKTDYHMLARYVPADQIDPEVIEKLDAIVAVAKRAQPRG